MYKQTPKLRKKFGTNEYGFADIPVKISGTTISRFLFSRERGGCSYCFPHGQETNNASYMKDLRCWKRYRKHQWRSE